MSDYRSCDNCRYKNFNSLCYVKIDEGTVHDLPPSRICQYWDGFRCPSCGGILSEIRTNEKKRFRHCYACHFEFEVNDD